MTLDSEQFPATKKFTYLNSPACGLISNETHKAVLAFHEKYLESASITADDWLLNEFNEVRQVVANFLKASLSEIALVPNFSFAYNSLLDSMGPMKTLIYKRDYPSLLMPLQLKGFELIELDDVSGFEIQQELLFQKLISEKIELLVLSHAQFRTGYLTDLEAVGDFCKLHGILFIVDATQSAGVVPISFNKLNVDALIFSNYKWMNAGFATGVMCLKSTMIHRFKPSIAGFGSMLFENDNLVYQPSIKSYEPAHPNMSALNGLKQAILEKEVLGMDNIRAHNQKLTSKLCEGLRQKGINYFGENAAIQDRVFVVIPSIQERFEKLKKKDITTTFREGYIRLGVHFYNTEQDVQRFLDTV
ncbi:MAG: aminotransferase class V-fold PLP-dependent enzyme [Flavobacteriales bacterium]|nr:aminotransferase class V-fold PLP-dependent enzyme [Flavobacteriales bacterium]